MRPIQDGTTPGDRVLNVEEAGRFIGLTPEVVRRKCRQGRLPAAKIGREWRFLESELIAWLRAGGERNIEQAADAGQERLQLPGQE